MATTKIFPITSTEVKAISYIADFSKTDNGKLIYAHGCSKMPTQASKDFEECRACGTGLNTVLSQHLIQSFAPGEITPENAMKVGKELCDNFLKGEYQYYLAVHNDKDHIHIHCIFNNVNMIDGLTFETHENQGKKSERAWKKLMDLSDELCKKYSLSVIENAEFSKGKSHYEWDMNRQGLSWKAKLKFAIDQVIKESDNFDDFLLKCKAQNIEVIYNPEHVIDLKFRLQGQQKFTRARTLGWYYETKQIKRRIDMYKGIVNYTPRTRIIRTDTEKMQSSFGLQRWADIQNMKEVSRVINILSKYSIEDKTHLEHRILTDYAKIGNLSEKLNTLNTQIEDLTLKIKSAKKVQKNKPVMDELKGLSGSKKKKFESTHTSEISDYRKASKQLKDWYPDGNVPTPDNMNKKRNALLQERSDKNEEYSSLKSAVNELNYARQAIDDYLKNERSAQEQRRNKENLE